MNGKVVMNGENVKARTMAAWLDAAAIAGAAVAAIAGAAVAAEAVSSSAEGAASAESDPGAGWRAAGRGRP